MNRLTEDGFSVISRCGGGTPIKDASHTTWSTQREIAFLRSLPSDTFLRYAEANLLRVHWETMDVKAVTAAVAKRLASMKRRLIQEQHTTEIGEMSSAIHDHKGARHAQR